MVFVYYLLFSDSGPLTPIIFYRDIVRNSISDIRELSPLIKTKSDCMFIKKLNRILSSPLMHIMSAQELSSLTRYKHNLTRL